MHLHWLIPPPPQIPTATCLMFVSRICSLLTPSEDSALSTQQSGRGGQEGDKQGECKDSRVLMKPSVVYIKKTGLQRHSIILQQTSWRMEREGTRKTVPRSALLLLRLMLLDKLSPRAYPPCLGQHMGPPAVVMCY